MEVAIQKKSKINIIDFIVDYYGSDTSKRAVNADFGCEYLTKDGRMCALGICMKSPSIELEGAAYDLNVVFKEQGGLDSLLKDEYTGHSLDFWGELQGLHDGRDYWDDKGLTTKGKNKVASLKAFYKGE